MKLNIKILEKLVEEVLNEQPPAPGGGEEKPSKPQPVKTDIPETPFEPDISQIKDKLKQILKQWQTKQYMSDTHRWKEYHSDIVKLYKHLTGEV